MQQFDAEILSNRTIAAGWMELVLRWREEAGIPLPGSFLTLRATRGFDPLLRRPFAFASFRKKSEGGPEATLLYQVRGLSTQALAELRAGALVDVLGPLGKGFARPEEIASRIETESPILIAGGIGLGPILFLARELELLIPGRFRFLAGFRDARSVSRLEFPLGTMVFTDDGSAGIRGRPLDWLQRSPLAGQSRLYACGPAPMLAAVASLAKEKGLAASLSAEQWMACGVGACMGCALPRPDGRGFLRACADGPVFDLGDIDWAAEAARSAPGGSPASPGMTGKGGVDEDPVGGKT